MYIALCDDEAEVIDQVRDCLSVVTKEVNEPIQLDVYSSSEELFREWGAQDYAVIMLDVEMEGTPGLEAAKRLRSKNHYKGEIIFLTYYPESAPAGEESRSVQYLKKPLDQQRFSQKIQSLVDEGVVGGGTLAFTTLDYQKILLPTTEIISFHSDNEEQVRNALALTTVGKRYLIRGTISAMEDDVCDKGFFRVHRCTIVNLAHVKKIEREYVILSDGRRIKAGRSKIKQFRQELSSFTLR